MTTTVTRTDMTVVSVGDHVTVTGHEGTMRVVETRLLWHSLTSIEPRVRVAPLDADEPTLDVNVNETQVAP